MVELDLKHSATQATMYKILKEENLPPFKRSLDIEITEKLTSSQLAQIAQKLFSRRFDLTFMIFYLPGDTTNDGGYASANWIKKNCTITIYDQTQS